MNTRYTAILEFNNNEVLSAYGNDLKKLVINALIHLECDSNYVSGKITDNKTGRIVHRCERVSRNLM